MTVNSQVSRSAAGVMLGIAAAIGWGAYIAATRHALAEGLQASDLAFLRFATSGIFLAPWLLFGARSRLYLLTWKRAATLTVLVGPPMVAVVVGANSLAPLASGVSIELSALAFGSLVLSRLVLKERLDWLRMVGLLLIGGRIVLLGMHTIAYGAAEEWGVLLFIAAGGMSAGYAALVRNWHIPPITAVSVVATISFCIYTPYYLSFEGIYRLLELPWPLLAEQIFAQGVIAGAAALIAFLMSVRCLGMANAAVLPLLTPLVAGCATWFLTGEPQTSCGWMILAAGALGSMALILDFPSYVSRFTRA